MVKVRVRVHFEFNYKIRYNIDRFYISEIQVYFLDGFVHMGNRISYILFFVYREIKTYCDILDTC